MSYIGSSLNTGQPSPGTVTPESLADTFVLPVEKGGTETVSVTGIVKGTGTGAFVAAVSGTDYEAPLPAVLGQDDKYLQVVAGVKTWSDIPPVPAGVNVYMYQNFGGF